MKTIPMILLVSLILVSMFSVVALAKHPPCIPNWQCMDWSKCFLGYQWRWCWDGCGHGYPQWRTCPPPCEPNWTCGNWTDCINGTQTRICNDGCGNTSIEIGNCTMPSTPISEPQVHETPKSNFWEIQRRMMEFLPPNKNNPCQMQTYVNKEYPPKRVFTCCFKWVSDEYKEDWISQYGDYEPVSKYTQYLYIWQWWKLTA